MDHVGNYWEFPIVIEKELKDTNAKLEGARAGIKFLRKSGRGKIGSTETDSND